MPSAEPIGRLACLACVAATALGASDCRRQSRPALNVAAAADTTSAFRELGANFEQLTGVRVVFTFGATGQLERQIAEGAPFDVFAAADVASVDDAVRTGACLRDSEATFAVGQLALVSAPGGVFKARAVGDLLDPRVRRIAIANPEHAPYGRAAQQAMNRTGVLPQVHDKLVYAENVRQALQFVQSGNVDVAIVARSLADPARDTDDAQGEWAPVPTELHEPIVQAMAVCAHGAGGIDAGRRFVELTRSTEGQRVLQKYGFLPASGAGTSVPR